MDVVLSSIIKELPGWMLVSLGFYVAFRVLRFPDLTVDASYIAGTVGAASIAVNFHSSLWGLILAALLAGIAGALTGVIYATNQRPAYKLLSGLLVALGFYSVNYRVMGRDSYAQYSTLPTFFNKLGDFEVAHGMAVYRPISVCIGLLLVFLVIVGLRLLFRTSLGLRLRTVGSRPHVISTARGPVSAYIVLGLVISNVIVGIGGWYHGAVKASANLFVYGTILHALAAAIIGELIIERIPRLRDRRTSVMTILIAPLVGATIYQFARSSITYAISLEIRSIVPNRYDLNHQDVDAFLAAVLIFLLMAIRLASEQWQERVALVSTSQEEDFG